MKPANNIIGIIPNVSIAPPVNNTSVRFIAISIDIIDIRDILIATWKADVRFICLLNIIVSNKIEVTSPLKIANNIMIVTGALAFVN